MCQLGKAKVLHFRDYVRACVQLTLLTFSASSAREKFMTRRSRGVACCAQGKKKVTNALDKPCTGSTRHGGLLPCQPVQPPALADAAAIRAVHRARGGHHLHGMQHASVELHAVLAHIGLQIINAARPALTSLSSRGRLFGLLVITLCLLVEPERSSAGSGYNANLDGQKPDHCAEDARTKFCFALQQRKK